jgi:hypothetical protein
MAFPQPGDTKILGIVWWYSTLPMGGGCGVVEAYASVYGTPDARIYEALGFNSDPLRFVFKSTDSFSPGDGVTFDVVEGNFAAYATNVTRV